MMRPPSKQRPPPGGAKGSPPPPAGRVPRPPTPRRPPPQKPWQDTTMMWGDWVTVCCTELASDRVSMSEVGTLATVLGLAVVSCAAAKGDYAPRRDGVDVLARQRAMLQGLAAAAFTWVVALPVSLAADAALAKHGLLSAAPFLRDVGAGAVAGQPPPQAEVLGAVLITLGCWRGIYAGLRPFI